MTYFGLNGVEREVLEPAVIYGDCLTAETAAAAETTRSN